MNQPKFLYRVDTRSPEEIFEHGFSPWGTNRDFFRHIVGDSYATDQPSPLEELDGFISTSEDMFAAVRYFTTLLVFPAVNPPRTYLYQIRATENFYGAMRTAQEMLIRIANNGLVYDQGDAIGAYNLLHTVLFGSLAYQNEWFSDGPIPRETIAWAVEINTIPIAPDQASHSEFNPLELPLLYLPDLASGVQINNPHFIPMDTEANHLPFHPNPGTEPIHVSIHPVAYFVDASGASGSSLSFACESGDNPTVRNQYLTNKAKISTKHLKCYTPVKVLKQPLKQNQITDLTSSFEPSYVYLEGQKSKQGFYLTTNGMINEFATKVKVVQFLDSAFQLYYDNYQRICLPQDPKTNLIYALVAVPTADLNFFVVRTAPSVTNQLAQKWILAPVAQKPGYFKIKNYKYKNFVLVRDTTTSDNFVFLMPEKQINPHYEEIWVVIDKNKTHNNFILPQKAQSQMLDLNFSWKYQSRDFYHPVPKTGWSVAGEAADYTFFYDLNTQKILHIEDINVTNVIRGLQNLKTPQQNWNWVAWPLTNAKEDNDKSLKWNFKVPPNYKNNKETRRFLYSVKNPNDVLWVIAMGNNWGALYTTQTTLVYPRSINFFNFGTISSI